MPKVSVIIPCYNVENYVGETLDSILSQTLTDIEVLCIDDKSTDNTLEILMRYADTDERIKIIAQPKNAGVSAARNLAIDSASGEFIYFIDSDDYLPDENTLSDMYNAATKNGANICGGSVILLNPNTGTKTIPDNKSQRFVADGFINYSDWPYDYGFTRFIYRRDWLQSQQLRFPLYIRQEDPVFFIGAMCAAGKFYALRRPTYVYRISYKHVKYRPNIVRDVFYGLRDCLMLASAHGMNTLYGNIMQHISNMHKHVRESDPAVIAPAVCEVFKLIYTDGICETNPHPVFMKIMRKHAPELYHAYTQRMNTRDAHRRIYLLFFIPFLHISWHRSFTTIKLFEVIPLIKVRTSDKVRTYWLFNIIPILKSKA